MASQVQYSDEAKRLLEQAVLGNDEDITKQLEDLDSTEQDQQHIKKESSKRKPAWIDEDDTKESFVKSTPAVKKKYRHGTYKEMLDHRYKNVVGTPEWAQLDSKKKKKKKGGLSDDELEEADDGEDILQKTGTYIGKSSTLASGTLKFKRCKDANRQNPAKSRLSSVEFHPTAQVMLAAGLDNNLSIFQIDGKNNPKIQSIFMDKFPIYTAHFTTDGHEVIMASRHKRFFYYDMIAGSVVDVPRITGLDESGMPKFKISPDGRFIVFLGKHGNMHLFCAKSKEWICSLKMNGFVEDVAFFSDGSKMMSFGDEGDVYVWDLQSRQCVHRFTDSGCVNGTSVDIAPNSQVFACGSLSGVVNIYDSSCLTERRPKPLKSVMNLTSACTTLKFNPASEMLCALSSHSEQAVKMIHLGSRTTYSNFPGRSDPLGTPYCTDFSLNSGYLTVGDDKGHALLYRLNHYGNY